jgi:hypothetical protein
MFPDPIVFLNYELKPGLVMKSKKEEEEDGAKFCSLKVPMHHEDKDSIFEWTTGPRYQKKHARLRSNQSTLRNTFMIVNFLNWQSALLKSNVDGEMPFSGSASIWEEIVSWGNSTQKSSVKDCKI